MMLQTCQCQGITTLKSDNSAEYSYLYEPGVCKWTDPIALLRQQRWCPCKKILYHPGEVPGITRVVSYNLCYSRKIHYVCNIQKYSGLICGYINSFYLIYQHSFSNMDPPQPKIKAEISQTKKVAFWGFDVNLESCNRYRYDMVQDFGLPSLDEPLLGCLLPLLTFSPPLQLFDNEF